MVKGTQYYHDDCYKDKVNGEWKDEKTKADIQIIKNLWIEHISKTVVFSQLYNELNNLVDRGIESEYLVFVMNYIIEHKLNLNYPAGFKYFIDKIEIRDAYAKRKPIAQKYSEDNFIVVEKEDTAPKFSVNKKPNGFQSIFSDCNK